jgi:hypothetical protein
MTTENTLANQSTEYEIWFGLLTQAVEFRCSPHFSDVLYKRAQAAHQRGEQWIYQGMAGDVDLTDLYEKTIILAKLKGI